MDREESVLARFKEAFISNRLAGWLRKLSLNAAQKSHEIAQFAHEALNLINREKSSEMDLGQIEDRFRRAQNVFKKFERENQSFLAVSVFVNLSEAEREKAEAVKEQFSRELRQAKLELASIRKRIDDKLLTFKNTAPAPSPIPVETVKS